MFESTASRPGLDLEQECIVLVGRPPEDRNRGVDYALDVTDDLFFNEFHVRITEKPSDS